MGNHYLISVVGPTAVGKTDLSIEIAKKLDCEIISADSRQFFKELEIGTAKPNNEQLKVVNHHFINSLSIQDEYDAGKFETDALKTLNSIYKSKKYAVLVGGSGLYCKSVWEGFDDIPEIEEAYRKELNEQFAQSGLEDLLTELQEKDTEYYEIVDRKNHVRVIRALEVIRSTGKKYSHFRKKSLAGHNPRSFENIKIGLVMDRELLYKRIDQRMDDMLSQGLIEEAKKFQKMKDLHALRTVGYTEIFPFLEGQYDYEECVRLLKRNSRRYAKRQMTWFKKDKEIRWFEPSEKQKIFDWLMGELNA